MTDLNQSATEEDENSKRYVVSSFKDSALLFMKENCELSIKGKARLRCLQGEISIYGYRIQCDGKFYPVYSPGSHSLLNLTSESCSSESAHCDPATLKTILKEEIPSITNKELSKVQHLGRNYDVVVLLKKESSQVFDFISSFKDFKNLFDAKPEKRELNAGLYLDSINLRIIENSPNKMVMPDFYERISSDFISCCASESTPPILLVSGGKDAGKSTFCRYLVNRTLNSYPSVAYLDVDVGQSEFTPGGCVSLTVVTEPIIGPPFTHCRQPVCSFSTGSTTPSDSTSCYVKCVEEVCQFYFKMNPRLPLIINTMGWIEGAGLYYLIETLLLTKPTIVVQLRSTRLKQNFEELSPKFVTKFVNPERGEYMRPYFLALSPRPDLLKAANSLTHKLYYESPVVGASGMQTLRLAPVDYRNLMVYAHIGQHLNNCETVDTRVPDRLSICEPHPSDKIPLHRFYLRELHWHRIPLRNIVVRTYNEARVDRSDISDLLNAAVIGLATIDPKWLAGKKLPACAEELMDTSEPIECLGFALVHHIIPEEKALNVISSVSQDVIKRVNCVMTYSDPLPKQLLLDDEIPDGGERPYVATPKDCVGSSSIKPRGRHMFRKRPVDQSPGHPSTPRPKIPRK